MLQNYFSKLRATLLLVFLCVAVSNVWGETTSIEYIFTSKAWAAQVGDTSTSWFSYKDGNQMSTGSGVQVTAAATGAGAQSPRSFSNISKIEVTYSTNSNKGAGSVKVSILEPLDETTLTAISTITQEVTKPTGGTGNTKRKLTYEYSDYLTGHVSLSVNCTENSIYIYSVTIYYSEESVPYISASDVQVAYTAGSGSIAYSVKNSEETAQLAATTTASWLTLGTVTSTAVPFTVTANEAASERTADVTLTYGSLTKVVKVAQAGNPSVMPTIAEVRAQATGAVRTKGIVTSIVGTTAYMQDATGGICVYGLNTLVPGNEYIVSGNLTTYSGLLEIANPQAELVSEGNEVTPRVVTLDQITDALQGILVKIENATVTDINGANTTVKQGDKVITVRGISNEVEYEVGDLLTFVGNVGRYNTSDQIANPTQVEVKQKVVTLASIYLEGTPKTTFFVGGTFSLGEARVMAKYAEEGSIDEDVTSEVTVSGFDSSEAGTQNVTLSYTLDEVTKTVSYAVAIVESTYFFYESFDTNEGQGGNDGRFGNFSSTGALQTDNEGWTFERGTAADQCAKFGTSGNAGVAETPALGFEGDATLTFKAASWTNDNTEILLSISGGGELSLESVTPADNEWTTYTVTITNATLESKLTFSSSSASYSRFFLDEVKVEPLRYIRAVTVGNYGTICLPYATSATTGATFYNVTGKVMTGDVLACILVEPIEGQLEAGKPYIFKATASELTATYTGYAVEEPVAGALVGTFEDTTAPMGSYVLSQNQLYVVDSEVTIAANRAYIDITAIPEAGEVKGVALSVGNATGIYQAPALGEGQAVIYDLQGRRVSNPTKGLYIVNGKKVLK